MELFKEDIKKRLEPCNLVIDQKAGEKINSITERYDMEYRRTVSVQHLKHP